MTDLTNLDPFAHAKAVVACAENIRRAIGLITEEEMAAVLLLNSAGTLATWRSQSKGPESVKLGKRVFYSLAGLSAWINIQNQQQNQPVTGVSGATPPIADPSEVRLAA